MEQQEGVVVIPATIEEATSQLGGLGRLLTAKEWERAAIVAAYVEVGKGRGRGQRRTNASPRREICDEFARRGIAGLTSSRTVWRVVKSWEYSGLPKPQPGETVELPTIDYPTQAEIDVWAGSPTQAETPTQTDDLVHETPKPTITEADVAAALQDPEFRKQVFAEMPEDEAVKFAKDAVKKVMDQVVETKDERAERLKENRKIREGNLEREKNAWFIHMMEWGMASNRLKEVAKKCVGADRPDDGTIEAIAYTNAEILAQVQFMDDLIHGRISQVPDDLSGLEGVA